jgi:hypothetical protein
VLCLSGAERFPADGGPTCRCGGIVLCLSGAECFPADGVATC